MRIREIRINARIYAGFGAVIALAAALAVLSISQLVGVGGQFTRLADVSDNAARSLEVDRLADSLRRLGLKYQVDGDEAAAQKFDTASTQGVTILGEAAKHATSEDQRRTVAAAAEAIGAVRQDFAELVKNGNQLKADKAKLLDGNEALGKAVDQLTAAARGTLDQDLEGRTQDVEAAILAVRAANWQFLATKDPKGPIGFKLSLGKAKLILTALGRLPAAEKIKPAIAPVGAALDAYAKSFDDFAARMLAADKLYNDVMQSKLEKVGELGEAVRSALTADMEGTKSGAGRRIATTLVLQIILAGAGLSLGAVFAIVIARGITGPLAGMTAAMTRLAAGDKSVAIPARDNKDELGEMAKAVEVFKHSMIEADRLAGEQRAAQERREKRRETIERHIGAFDQSVGRLLQSLSAASGEMRVTAETMSKSAAEATRQVGAVTSASQQASANVETAASATEEMAASVAEINRQVAESARIGAEAVEGAARTNVTVKGLSEAAQKIGEVVQLIQDIAAQTNLLALNATIEAARAGEAGKGFAVVASEVKTLATQTAKATEDISSQIRAIQSSTGEAVQAITGIDGTIGRISEISTAIASAIDEQQAATKEITRSTREAALGTSEVSRDIASVNQAASEAGAAAAQVLTASTELDRQAESLRVEVDQFLANIRAA